MLKARHLDHLDSWRLLTKPFSLTAGRSSTTFALALQLGLTMTLQRFVQVPASVKESIQAAQSLRKLSLPPSQKGLPVKSIFRQTLLRVLLSPSGADDHSSQMNSPLYALALEPENQAFQKVSQPSKSSKPKRIPLASDVKLQAWGHPCRSRNRRMASPRPLSWMPGTETSSARGLWGQSCAFSSWRSL